MTARPHTIINWRCQNRQIINAIKAYTYVSSGKCFRYLFSYFIWVTLKETRGTDLQFFLTVF